MLRGSGMKYSMICLAIFLAGSTAAMAQETTNSPACSRSATRIVKAGVDMDVERCKEAVARQARVQTEDLLIKTQAELLIGKSDLDEAARHQAELEQRQAELEKMCAGVPDCAKLLKPEASTPAPQPEASTPAPQSEASAPAPPPYGGRARPPAPPSYGGRARTHEPQ